MLTLQKRADKSRFRLPFLASIVIGLVFLVTACGGSDSVSTSAPTESQGQTTTSSSATATPTVQIGDRKFGGEVGYLAPEFSGIDAWINSRPLTMEALRGQVVLIDFWTYTCINCIRTFPFLKQWNSRYSDDGLVIVGVHAPEFEFEKIYENVVEATEANNLSWAMAQDNDFKTWRSYQNRFWPAKYLIDKDGVVRYTHFGEGGYAETEELIRELLAEANPSFLETSLPLPEDQTLDPGFLVSPNAEVTRELYGGYSRGESDRSFGNGGYVHQMEYFDSKKPGHRICHQRGTGTAQDQLPGPVVHRPGEFHSRQNDRGIRRLPELGLFCYLHKRRADIRFWRTAQGSHHGR